MLAARAWTDETYAAARVRARSALLEALPPGLHRDTYAAQVDMCAADRARKRPQRYLRVMSRVVSNVRVNGALLTALCTPRALVRATHRALATNTPQAQRDARMEERIKTLMKRAETEAQRITQRAAAIKLSQQPRCPKCKRTENIARVTAALRRGDEGMVTQCICANENCGFKWNLAS